MICETDEEAVARAKQMPDGHDIEVWQFGRKVTTLRRSPHSRHRHTAAYGLVGKAAKKSHAG